MLMPQVLLWAPSMVPGPFWVRQKQERLYVGFGSMVNDQPERVGKIILDVTSELDLPVLLNTGWGGGGWVGSCMQFVTRGCYLLVKVFFKR